MSTETTKSILLAMAIAFILIISWNMLKTGGAFIPRVEYLEQKGEYLEQKVEELELRLQKEESQKWYRTKQKEAPTN